MPPPCPLYQEEEKFLASNYKNYTALELLVSLNKIRGTSLPHLKVEQVRHYIWKHLGGTGKNSRRAVKERKTLEERIPPIKARIGSGNSPANEAEGKKVEALKNFASEIADDLSEPFWKEVFSELKK